MLGCLKYKIEIPLTLIVFAFAFGDSVTPNWLMFKTCYVTLGFNESECALLGSAHPDNMTAELEEKVQPHVTVLSMTKSLIEAFGSLLVCFFLGPWSDKYGRKPVLLLTFGGYVVATAILAIISAFPSLSPWFFVLYALPLCFSGGLSTLFAGVLCYVTDITSSEERGIRMAIMFGIVTLGSLLGLTTSSYALKLFGYVIMYSITTVVILLAWLFILFVTHESLAHPETENKFGNLFRPSLMKESVKVTFKRRDGYNRAILVCLISILVAYVAVFAGNSVTYLYLVKNFNWDLKKFTLFSSASEVLESIGSILNIYLLHNFLGFNESIVIFISLLTSCFGSILFGIASNDWQIYVATALKCLKGAVSPMGRSLISKIVTEDCGKVYSFMALCETLIGLIGSTLYTYIYNETLSTFPGAFSLFTAGLFFFEVIVVIGIIIMQRKQGQEGFTLLIEDPVIN